MDWPRLDTSPWNLWLGATAAAAVATAAVIACSPGSTPAGESDDCDTGGCCELACCYEPDCYDDYDYECYTNDDCGPDAKCTDSHECVPVTVLPECQDALSLVPLELPQAEEPFASLAFVDANGDAAEDLVVGRVGAAHLYLGPGDAPPVALPVPPDASVGDIAAGDFDGDGDADLVLSTYQGHLVTLGGDGAGGFVLAADQDVSAVHRDLTALDWDGDGALDLAGVSSDETFGALVHLGSGTGELIWSPASSIDGSASALAGLDFDANAYGDLVVQGMNVTRLFLGAPSGDLTEDGILPADPPSGVARLLAGHINATGSADVVGHPTPNDGVELVAWPDALGAPEYYRVENAGLQAAMGDYDGDGARDVVIGHYDLLTFLRGDLDGPLLFSCQSSYSSGVPLGEIVMGDFDGNGRADVAAATDGPVTVLLTP
jgi:hypothetical protein